MHVIYIHVATLKKSLVCNILSIFSTGLRGTTCIVGVEEAPLGNVSIGNLGIEQLIGQSSSPRILFWLLHDHFCDRHFTPGEILQ